MGHNPIFATLKILVGKSYAPWLSDFIKYWENRRFFGIFGPTYVVRNDLSYILIYHNPTFGDLDDLEFLRVESYAPWLSDFIKYCENSHFFYLLGSTYVVRNDLSYILIYHNPTFDDFDDLEFLLVEGYGAWISAITSKLAKTGTFLVFGNG